MANRAAQLGSRKLMLRVLGVLAVISGILLVENSNAYTLSTITASPDTRTVVYGNWVATSFNLETDVSGGSSSVEWAIESLPSNVTAEFLNPRIESGKATTLLALSQSARGPSVGTYTFKVVVTGTTTQEKNLTLNITPRPVKITGNFQVSQKIYDGLTSSTISSSTLGLEPLGANLDRGLIPEDDVTLVPISTLSSKDAGSRTASLMSSTLSGSASSNYELQFTDAPTATGVISAKPLLVTGLSFSKVYDGLTTITPSGTPAIAGGVVDGDATPIISGSPTWTLADPNVGINKSVTVAANGYTLNNSNYFLDQTTLTNASVTKANLTVNFSVSSRAYNGSNDVTAQTSVSGFTGLASRDSSVTASFTSATAASKNEGTHAVTIGGLTLSDAQALGNYTVQAQSGRTVVISKKNLTLGGSFTATSRAYDGTNVATGDTSNLTLVGVIGSESVTFSDVLLRFSSANQGSRTVSVHSFSISGADSSNYQASVDGAPTTSATIGVFTLTVTATVSSKVYDGSNSASVTCSANTFSDGLNVSVNCSNAQFTGDGSVALLGGVVQSQSVSIGTVSLSNNSLGNYALPELSITGQAAITQKPLSISGITGVNRVYNGTTDAAVTGSPVITAGQVVSRSGVVDDVFLDASNAQYSFANKSVGTAKAISASGFALTGTRAGNYSVASLSGVSANITTREITVSVSHPGKTYDGTTAAGHGDVTLTVLGQVPGDVITADFTGASFDVASAGTRTLSVTGIYLSGADASNYTVASTASNSAILISKKALAIGQPRFTYNGSASGNARFQTDGQVRVCDSEGSNCVTDQVYIDVAGEFLEKYVHEGPFSWTGEIVISGEDKDNYSYTLPTSPVTGRILTKTLGISGLSAAASKLYDGTTDAATLISGTPALSGVVDGSPTLVGTGTYTFASKFVAEDIRISTTGFSISGADLDGDSTPEYSLSQPRWDRDITVRELTIDGSFEANNKVYDRSVAATFKTNSLSLDGLQASDSVSLTSLVLGFASASANESTPTVVSITSAALSGANVDGIGGAEYSLSLSGAPTATATISRMNLDSTLALTISNKVYNGTTSASFGSGPTVTPISGDTVSVLPGAIATFQTRTAGNTKPVDVQNLQLTGAHASNYTLTDTRIAFGTANITKRSLSITGITSPGKVYDRTNFAPKRAADGDECVKAYLATCVVDDLSAALSGVQSNSGVLDSVSLVKSSGSFTFNSSLAGTRTLNGRDYSLSGDDATNYTLTQPSLTLRPIDKKLVVVSATGGTRVYDATNNASGIVTLSVAGVITGDSFTTSASSIVFDDPDGRDVGEEKPITASGLSISGGQSANYTLNGQTTATTTGSITPFSLTLTASATDKIYDGNNSATANCSVNRFSVSGTPDDVEAVCSSATFNSKDVSRDVNGVEINQAVSIVSITLTGADSSNYSLPSASATTAAKILAKPLVASGFTPQDKVYDGSRFATFSVSSASLTGFVGEDTFSFSEVGGLFASSDVVISNGVVQAQNVRLNSWTFSGASSAVTNNYTIDIDNSTTQAKITPKPLSVTITGPTRVYNDTTAATLTATYSALDLISADRSPSSKVVASATGTFVDQHVGTNKTINIATATLSGSRAHNYEIVAPATTLGNITPATLTFTVTATNKEYDGLTSATVSISDNRLSGDVFTVSYSTATFANAQVGNSKTVTVTGLAIAGEDAGNYTHETTRTAQANITRKQIAVSGTFTAAPKVYDKLTTAVVNNTSGLILGNVIASDLPNVTIATTTATFNNSGSGTGKTVTLTGLTISGSAAGNYTVNVSGVTPYQSGEITPKPLTPVITISDRRYDGTTTATISSISITPLAGDSVSVVVANASAAFDTPDQGTSKEVSVTGLALTGASAANYSIESTTTASASITGAPVTVVVTAENKVYNANNAATVTIELTGLDPDITASVVYSSAVFAQVEVGNSITVTVSGLQLTGNGAPYYALTSTTATTTADITKRTVTITGQTRVYDGTISATAVMSGVIPEDSLTLSPTVGVFSDKNAGTNKTISLGAATLTGSSAGNYQLPDPLNVQGTIQPKTLLVQFTPTTELTQPSESVAVIATDDRIVEDVLMVENSSAAAIRVGNELVLEVSGITLSGPDSGNYVVAPTFTSVLMNLPPIQTPPAPAPSISPTPTPTPTPTPSATVSPNPRPTAAPTPRPTSSPRVTVAPSATPAPSRTPTASPPQNPVAEPPISENTIVGDGLSSWLSGQAGVVQSAEPDLEDSQDNQFVKYDTGAEVQFTARGSIDLSSVRSVTAQQLSSERIGGFRPGASLFVEVLGARTGARFVATTASQIDSAILVEAIKSSIPTQAADFFKLDEVGLGQAPRNASIWTEDEQLKAYDYFQASGLANPLNIANLDPSQYSNWIYVKGSASGYVPGSTVFLTLTSTPLVIAEGTVNRLGGIRLSGSWPVELLQAGEHRVRLVGIRSIGGVGVDGNGEITLSDETIQEIERFDLGTKATVRMSGPTPEGDLLNAIRVVPLTPFAPWWTLWFILIGFLSSAFAKRRNWLNTPVRSWLAVSWNLAVALPAVVIGWISSVSLVSWVGLGLGLLGLGLTLLIRPERVRIKKAN